MANVFISLRFQDHTLQFSLLTSALRKHVFSNAHDNMCLYQLPDADDALHFSWAPTQSDRCSVSSYVCAWHRMLCSILRPFFHSLTYRTYGLIIQILNTKIYQVEFLIISHHVTPNAMCRVITVNIATAGSTDSARQYAQLHVSTTGSPQNFPFHTAAWAEGDLPPSQHT